MVFVRGGKYILSNQKRILNFKILIIITDIRNNINPLTKLIINYKL